MFCLECLQGLYTSRPRLPCINIYINEYLIINIDCKYYSFNASGSQIKILKSIWTRTDNNIFLAVRNCATL